MRTASSVMPRVLPASNTALPISAGTNSTSFVTPAAAKSSSVADMISGPSPSPAASAMRMVVFLVVVACPRRIAGRTG